MITRRSLIAGFATLLAAPAIVRASSIMPVRPWAPTSRSLRFRVAGTDAYGTYKEEFFDALPESEEVWFTTMNCYRSLEISMLEPIFIPRGAALA